MNRNAIALAAMLACLSAPAGGAPKDAAIEKLARQFVALLGREDFQAAAAGFDPKMRKAMPPAKLAAAWGALTGQMGRFVAAGGVRTERIAQFQVALVTSQFARGRMDVKVVFDADKRISGLWFVPSRPAEYKPPKYVNRAAFGEREVTVGRGKWALPGTLAMPAAAGPVPALVLVHGSGPNDRDETLGPNKPFRDLAWGLASRKIAVLRYEKRTRRHRKEMAAETGLTVWAETVEDALLAAELLRKTPGVDPRRVFVLGHSLGGMLVPRIAAKDARIAGFVILAGATRPIEEMILQQSRYVCGLDGRIDEREKAGLDRLERIVEKIRDPKLTAESGGALLGAGPAYWLDLRGYRPAEEAKRVRRPILVLQGHRDYQVTVVDFATWKLALAGRKDVRFRLYGDLNHLFIAGRGKSTPAEYTACGHVAPVVIDDIARWIASQPAPKAKGPGAVPPRGRVDRP